MDIQNVEIPNGLIEKILSGNVALFIGAGASIPAGLPSSSDLVLKLKNTFKDCNQNLEEFMDICQDIEETPPYNRNDLETYIGSQLDLITLTDGHKELTQYNWSAIFTTNFDNVLETAYSTTIERLKPCQTISKESPSVNISDRSRTYLFKLMGTLDAYDSTSGMVLTRSDYHHALIKRNHYLRLLSDYIKSGVILYIGYSFKDQIVKDIISEVSRIYGSTKLPWSYMILLEIPTDKKSQYFFDQNKIIPIKADFLTFFKSLTQFTQSTNSRPEKIKPPVATLKILGKHIGISESNYNMYASCFEFISEENLYLECTLIDFLKGKIKYWEAYRNDWDFKRNAYNILEPSQTIQTILQEEYTNYEADKNKILYLTGMPGCGKTVYTFRIGYEYYRSGKGPVLLFNRNNNIDFKIIAAFIEDVNTQYDKLFKETDKLKPIKPLLIFDDVALSLRDLARLKDFLISRGRSTLIIANCRENEFESKLKENNIKIPLSDRFTLNETLTKEESKDIIEYLFKHKFITSKGEKWEKLIEENYENSIFATFYSLVHPSKKPLEEIIKDQFNNLGNYSKKAFITICCFSQFDISVNIELIVRVLDTTYDEYYNILQEVKKIIFEDEDYNGNVFYKAHHRIIAKKTIDFFVPNSDLLSTYISILKSCLLYGNHEREIIEKFLIENFSKDSKSEFDLLSRSLLFKAVCDSTPTRTLSHHLGLLKMEMEEYLEAENYLENALNLPREASELYRGESDQNILTSLGKLNSLKALALLKKNNHEESFEKFQLAESYFNDAKHGEYPNAYAYHANAYMWFQKSRIENPDRNEKDASDSISKSLEIINTAKDNLNSDELQPLIELETQIWAYFENEDKVKQFSNTIKERYGSINGYFIYATYYFQKASATSNFKTLYLDAALKSLNEGLSFHPNDEKCLALKCKIFLMLNSSTDEELYDLLNEWYNNLKSDNAYLLFNFARIAFINGFYDRSRELFEELQNGVGLGNKQRSKVGNEIINKLTNEPKFFHGEVSEVFNKLEGKIKVSFTQRLYINFRPITAKFNVVRSSQVNFNIAFGFRGPMAVNITKA